MSARPTAKQHSALLRAVRAGQRTIPTARALGINPNTALTWVKRAGLARQRITQRRATVRALAASGLSRDAIAARLAVHPRTITRDLHAPHP